MKGMEKARNDWIEDRKYHSKRISKLIRYVMRDGKKTIAENIVYDSLELLKKELNSDNVIKEFNNIIEKGVCKYEIKKLKFGGATYQCPILSTPFRCLSICMRKIVKNSRKTVRVQGIPMHKALFLEYKGILEGNAQTIKEKVNMEKLAYANRSYTDTYRNMQKKNKKFIFEESSHKEF